MFGFKGNGNGKGKNEKVVANVRVGKAKTKPTASAPIATDRRASSSLVMPQIFTNME